MDLLKDLNQQQRRAVTTTDGPVLILAGAGSGKTKALTHRIAYLVQERQVTPSQILAVTFTNKAAGEMKKRVASLLAKTPAARGQQPQVGTFHSVCVRILRSDGPQLGLSRSFTIYDAHDSLVAVKSAMERLQVSPKQFNPSYVRHQISSAKNELVDPAKYTELARDHQQQTIAGVYREYQKLLQANDALDFDDLLTETVRLFRSQPAVLEKYQRLWRYVMVDEYQDTNHVQYVLTKLLAVHGNLCVVGDPDQGIYSWRGADIRNILQFEEDYPEAVVIKLEQNYRSTQTILDAAQQVIAQNTQRKEKALWTEVGAGEPIRVFAARNERDEADQVAREITAHQASGGSLGDIVVLYRTNAQSRVLEERLIKGRIPYKIVGGVRFYERKEIKDVLAYLQLMHNPNDTVAFQRIVNVPTRGIGTKAVLRLLDASETRSVSVAAVLADQQALASFPAASRKAVERFAKLFAQLRLAAQERTVGQLIADVLEQTGYLDWIDDSSVEAAARLENVAELRTVAQRYDQLTGEEGLAVFLEDVALITDIDSYDPDASAVTLMTLHAAKGLEFPVVMIIGLEENIFPHSRSQLNPDEMEEERRLAYVGMTRAMQKLYLLYANSRVLYGSVQSNLPSRFLADIPEHLIANVEQSTVPWAPPTSMPSSDSQEIDYLEVGDTVLHPKFGKGTVSDVSDSILTVAFDSAGTKKLSAGFAGLLKKV